MRNAFEKNVPTAYKAFSRIIAFLKNGGRERNIILGLLLLCLLFPPIGILLLVGYLLNRYVLPPAGKVERGLILNRTKAVGNFFAIVLLVIMIFAYEPIATTAWFHSMTGFYNPSQAKAMINLFYMIIASWLGYQAFLSMKIRQFGWMWIFGIFAVLFFPFLHFSLGALWIAVDKILIALLLISTFAFRLPKSFPLDPHRSMISHQVAPTPSLESDLRSLQRLKEEGLLSEEEFHIQKTSLLEKHKTTAS